jgi:hypothetical protein
LPQEPRVLDAHIFSRLFVGQFLLKVAEGNIEKREDEGGREEGDGGAFSSDPSSFLSSSLSKIHSFE